MFSRARNEAKNRRGPSLRPRRSEARRGKDFKKLDEVKRGEARRKLVEAKRTDSAKSCLVSGSDVVPS
jgi:hypothetical protein